MPKRALVGFGRGRVGRRCVEAAFDGGDIVNDGDAPLLRLVDKRIGLTRAAVRQRRCSPMAAARCLSATPCPCAPQGSAPLGVEALFLVDVYA